MNVHSRNREKNWTEEVAVCMDLLDYFYFTQCVMLFHNVD